MGLKYVCTLTCGLRLERVYAPKATFQQKVSDSNPGDSDKACCVAILVPVRFSFIRKRIKNEHKNKSWQDWV